MVDNSRAQWLKETWIYTQEDTVGEKIGAIPGAICMTIGTETSKGTDGTAE